MIGRVGDGAPFLVGRNTYMQAGNTGELLLAYNDSHGNYFDNSGSFSVAVCQNPCNFNDPAAVGDPPTLMEGQGAALEAARPNPFRNSTKLAFTTSTPGSVQIEVMDASGRRIVELSDGDKAIGRHIVSWDGRDGANRRVPAGAYFIRASLDGREMARKVIVLR